MLGVKRQAVNVRISGLSPAGSQVSRFWQKCDRILITHRYQPLLTNAQSNTCSKLVFRIAFTDVVPGL